MSTRAPSHDRLAEMADDIHQLVEPFAEPISQRIAGRTRWTAITQDPLLDQLRAATAPGGGVTERPERRSIPDSRPPIRLDVHDRLAEINVELSSWQDRLNLRSPPEFRHGCEHPSCQWICFVRVRGPLCARAGLERVDYQKAVLRQLVGAAANLAPSIADQLADDVHQWWRTAAVTVGLRPEHLRSVR